MSSSIRWLISSLAIGALAMGGLDADAQLPSPPKPPPVRDLAQAPDPRTLEEALATLKERVSAEILLQFAQAQDEHVALRYDDSLGAWIRHNWGLRSENGPLYEDLYRRGLRHPDDMSRLILTRFWRHLHAQPLEVQEQLTGYPKFWEQARTKQPAYFIEDARPVARAMTDVARQLKWTISYEDPPYVNIEELLDLTVTLIDGRHSIVPRGGRILVPDGLAALAATEDPVVLLESILGTERMAKGTVRRFTVLRSGSMFHVVPTKVLDAEGRWQTLTPALDTPVSFSRGEISLGDFLQALCGQITAHSGVPVTAGNVAAMLASNKVKLETGRGPAREFLVRALASVSRPFAWLLFYSPSDAKYYLHLVPPGSM